MGIGRRERTIDFPGCAFFVDGRPNLSGTQHESFNFLFGFNLELLVAIVRGIRKNPMEMILSAEILQW
jgi:hypothetical protein